MTQNLQPPWSQTGKRAGTRDAIVYTETAQAGQRVIAVLDDGTEVAIPHLPFRVMLDPSGNVCSVVVSTNRDAAEFSDRYDRVTSRIRRKKGWILWDYNPSEEPIHAKYASEDEWKKARTALQEKLREKARTASGRFSMSNDRLTEILELVANNAELQRQTIEALKTGDIRAAERIADKAKRSKEPGE